MEEMREETPRSGMSRRRYIKRWLILLAVGVVLGGGRTLAEMFLPAEVGSMVGGGLGVIALIWGLIALALSVVWTMNRAKDVGKDEAWGLLVLVPIVNIVAVVIFASLPSRDDAEGRT